MIRSITGFHLDSDGDWVAELSCYHNQHVRHRPPFQPRPWVLDPDGRAGRVGTPIDCPLCDRAELPDGLTVTGRAGPWDHHSLPDALRSAHQTPQDQWGRLWVRHGSAGFQFDPDADPAGSVAHLEAGSYQPIPPGRSHRVVVSGDATLELELLSPSSDQLLPATLFEHLATPRATMGGAARPNARTTEAAGRPPWAGGPDPLSASRNAWPRRCQGQALPGGLRPAWTPA